MKFRKKPVIIEASQWMKNGDHPKDNCEYYKDPSTYHGVRQGEGQIVRYYRKPSGDGEKECDQCGFLMKQHGWIDTLEGGHIVCVGDWIITGVAGENYTCKPKIFESTYEKVDE